MAASSFAVGLRSSTRSPILMTTTSRDAVVGELFDEHGNGLYRLALAMLHDAQAAQDVVQDTFLKLIAHIDVGGALPNARGWLYTVAAHGCRDRQRGLARWLPWIAERDVRPAKESPDLHDGADAVFAAIRTLPPRDRLLIALRAQGLSYREIADAAGIRSTSVGQLLARALGRLEVSLTQRAMQIDGLTD
jgi:RNA polymerase sigma-70 factor (ECF subfamily)